MTISNAQALVDKWIAQYGVSYFAELTNLGILMEEVGELARLMVRKYGEQSSKDSDLQKNIPEELADILWVVICLANQMNIDLTSEFEKNMAKKTSRDSIRHLTNEKLLKEKRAE